MVLGVLVFSLTPIVIDNTILNVALPEMQRSLQSSQSEQEWIVNAYALTFASFLVLWGVVADRFGRRRTLLAGTFGFGVASVAAAFGSTAEWVIACRALMGITGAAVLPATLAIITEVFPREEQAKAIGVWAAYSGVAVAAGPITGGLLVHASGWDAVFLVNAPMAVVSLVAIKLAVPESRATRAVPIDVAGLGLLLCGLGFLVYGIILGGQRARWNEFEVWGTAVGGLALLALFVWHARRTAHPALDLRLFRIPSFGISSLVLALNFCVLFSALFLMTYYLQAVRHEGPVATGSILLPVAVALLVISPFSVRWAQRFGTRRVCTVGFLLVAVACLSALAVGATTPMWGVAAILFVAGGGIATVFVPATGAMMQTLPADEAGTGSAASNAVRQIGGALGLALSGCVLAVSYRGSLEHGVVATFPMEARNAATDSISGALAVAADPRLVPTVANRLLAEAEAAFISAMHATFAGLAVVAVVGATIAARWLRDPA
ncbi:MAG: MFS transporter [Patulibacter sp.]